MRSKSKELKQEIIGFVDSFFDLHYRTPSLGEVGDALDITKQTVMRYLREMTDEGTLEYNGKTILTRHVRDMTTQHYKWLPVSGTVPCGDPQTEEEQTDSFVEIPTSMLGDGKYYVLIADGDSMIGAGIADGDLVIASTLAACGAQEQIAKESNTQQNISMPGTTMDESTASTVAEPETDETLHGDYRGEAQEVFLTEENIICISRFMSHMAWSADYDIYQIRNNKFVWVKGITDPGYTGGIGLYLDNEDGYDYEDGALYAVDADGSGKEGKYDSYKQAINSELNPYGFTLYKNGQDGYGGSGKYQIAETKKVQKIYGFSLYATIEDFENEDKGI